MKWFVFILIVLAIVGIGAYGYQQGWYTVSREGDDHKTKFEIDVDNDKLESVKEKVKKKAEDRQSNVKEKAGETGDKVKKDADKP